MRAELAEALASGHPVDAEVLPPKDLEQPLPAVHYAHTPPTSFVAGQPLQIEILAYGTEVPRLSVRLHCRRLNQAEQWHAVEMAGDDGPYVGTIPDSLTDSAYPVQYFFELRDRPDRAWLYPGLDETLSNRPYFVVRQS